MNIPTREQLLNNGINVAIAIPLERNIRDIAFLSIIPILQKGYGYIGGNYGRTDMARNQIAKDFMDSDFTHVLMMDSDHIHPPDLVERLARWVINDPEKKIVSGINFRRSAPYDPCVYMEMENGQLAAPLRWDNGIGLADVVGFGCVLISREVFPQLERPYFAYGYAEEGSQSEDIYFSLQCKQKGIKIWVDTTTTSPHITDRMITEKDFRYYVDTHPEMVAVESDKANPPSNSIAIPSMGINIG